MAKFCSASTVHDVCPYWFLSEIIVCIENTLVFWSFTMHLIGHFGLKMENRLGGKKRDNKQWD